MKPDGWSVYRNVRDGSLILRPGADLMWPLGYTFLGWTAGSKRDGKNLLNELTLRELERR